MSTAALQLIRLYASLMRRDVLALWRDAAPGEKRGTYRPKHTPVSEDDLLAHLHGEQPIGLYVLDRDQGPAGLTRVAIVDIDDKDRKLSWPGLCEEACRVVRELLRDGLMPWACRSGSGHGIHLWLYWSDGQSSQSVRELLRRCVAASDITSHVDIFPTADRLGEGELGSLIALPFSRRSRPITDLMAAAVQEDLAAWHEPTPPASRPISQPAPLPSETGAGIYGPVNVDVLRTALSHIPSDTYERWRDVGMALKHGSEGRQLPEADAERLWTEWASRDPKFDQRGQDYNWRRFKPNGSMTIGTIWHLAGEAGWRHQEAVKPTAGAAGPRWRSDEAPDFVQRLNQDHFFAVEGGRATIFIESWDPTLQRHRLVRMRAEDFKLAHCDTRVVTGHNGKGVAVVEELGIAWLKSEFRRKYPKGIILRPEGCDDETYNLWRGWTVPASEAGSCDLFKEHVLHNICEGDKDAYDYVFSWCAYTVQKPHTPIGTALVLRGDRGTGKSTFARVIGELFGQHFMQVTSGRDLTGRFNSHLRDCILLFADEAVWAGNRSEESTLKGLITEPFLSIEGKGRDLYQCRNMLHLIIATNHDWSVPAGLDERRFMALHCGDGQKQNTAYFSRMWRQLEEGGRSRLLHELLTHDITGFDPYNVPQTQELTRQKILSLDPWGEWWLEKLEAGLPLPTAAGWETPVPVIALFLDYVSHCRLSGHRTPKNSQYLLQRLRQMLPETPNVTRQRINHELDFGFTKVAAGSLQSWWRLPPLDACRAFFDRRARANTTWPEAMPQGTLNATPGDEDIPF